MVGATYESSADFDYYVTFEEDAGSVAGKGRWGELPIAARLNSDDGQELLARGWNATKAEFKQNLREVRKGLSRHSDEEIMIEDDNLVRHHCASLGAYAGPPIHLYNEFGNGIRTPDRFVWACKDFDKPWIIPADVHY